jgi:integrase
MNKFNYQSIYAPYFRQFIGIKKGLGFVPLRTEWIFLELDAFFLCKKVQLLGITKDQIEDWRSTRINDAPSTIYTKYSILSQFCKYMCKAGYDCYIPRLPAAPAKDRFTPYIFTNKEITNIIEACDQLQLYDKHFCSILFMMPAMLRLLYATGLRISEALSLKNKDVDFGRMCLYVRKSKNGEERIAPLSETLVKVLRQYLYYRDRMPIAHLCDDNRYFFVSSIGSSCVAGTVYKWFRKALASARILHQGNHNGPRVHDLRHTFAVHSLVKMAKSGLDLYYSLPLLSTCLGHKSLQSTEQYVRLTAEIYQDVLKDEKGVCSYIFPRTNKIINNGNE